MLLHQLLLIPLMCVFIFVFTVVSAEASLRERYFASAQGKFAPQSEEVLQIASGLFFQLLTGDRPAVDSAEWKACGMRAYTLTNKQRELVVVEELEGNHTGRGFYVFSVDSKSRVGLMMPHRYFDKDSGKIGFEIFSRGDFRFAAWNTTHRYGGPGRSKAQRDHSGDLAHAPRSFFTALTRAYARALPKGLLIQLHGFTDKIKRRGDNGVDAIMSAGGPATPVVRNILNCFKAAFGRSILLYPDETPLLGAATNISGKILRHMNHQGFVHIELGAGLRKRLLEDAEAQDSMVRCLTNE